MRVVAIIALAFAAFMVLMGAITSSWGRVDTFVLDDQVTIRWGLTEQIQCSSTGFFTRDCDSYALSEIGWPDSAHRLGTITFITGLLITAWLGIGAMLAGLQTRSARLVNVGAMAGTAIGMVPAALFSLLTPPSHAALEPSLGSSFWLYVTGSVLGVVGAALATRSPELRARDRRQRAETEDATDGPLVPPHIAAPPPPGAPRGAVPSPVPVPPPPVQVPSCPQCGSPGVWLHERRSFSCVRCNLLLRSAV